MSGGSYNYAYSRVEDVADALRRAFATHLELVAKAMHDIEWVDSHDAAPDTEHEAIRAALGTNTDAAQMAEIAADLRRLVDEAEAVLARQADPPLAVTNPSEGPPT